MKKILITICSLSIFACAELDTNPTQSVGSAAFYSNEQELRIAANDLYQQFLWKTSDITWTDDAWHRQSGGVTPITDASINSETGLSSGYWTDLYKGIARANVILENLEGADVAADVVTQFEAEVRFLRAYYYSVLVSHFGNVPLITTTLDLNSAFEVEREAVGVVKQFIYDELDFASGVLPVTISNGIKTATKGAVYGIKARIALYMGDYALARDAAKAVMDLGEYDLHEDYGSLFYKANGTDNEIILSIPRSVQFEVVDGSTYVRQRILRNRGGWTSTAPSWSIVDIHECTDGLTIDQSPLYDPHDPFANRDPRLSENVVPHGSQFLSTIYQPHVDSLQTFSFATNGRIKNNDSRGNTPWASWTGMAMKKGIEEHWIENTNQSENDKIILRYADILLMYAEAKIELDDIDNSVLDAINQIRARAYKVDVADVANYPEITTTDQAELRTALRRERRVELFNEGLRYMDLIRWRIAEKALNTQLAGMNNPDILDRNQWPFNDQILPTIDADGLVDHSAIIAAGYARELEVYTFDASRQYLWPVPAAERNLNSLLDQNTNY